MKTYGKNEYTHCSKTAKKGSVVLFLKRTMYILYVKGRKGSNSRVREDYSAPDPAINR